MKAAKGGKEKTIKRRSPFSFSAMRALHPLLAGVDRENITFDRSDRPDTRVIVRGPDGKEMTPEEAVRLYLEWGNNWARGNYVIRSRDDVSHYFVVNTWKEKPVIFFIRRNSEEAVELARIKMPEKLEKEFIAFTPAIDAAAESLMATNKDMAVAYLTDYSNSVAERVFKTWKNLYAHLFVKYMDGNIKTAKEIPEGYSNRA